MEEEFEHLAGEIGNCHFSFEDLKYSRTSGSRFPVSVYYLNVDHKNHIIELRNELGLQNTGTVTTTISNIHTPIFEITNRSQLLRLFTKKNILKIKCGDKAFEMFLQDAIINTNLEKLSRDNLFEPRIYNEVTGDKMTITTEYHLEFEDKIGVIKPLVDFYKAIINYAD